jgi:hypothetical protein
MFQRRCGQAWRKGKQKIAAIDIQPDVLVRQRSVGRAQLSRSVDPDRGDGEWAPGKNTGRSPARSVTTLTTLGLRYSFTRADGRFEGAHDDARITGATAPEPACNHARIDQRLVPLHVDHPLRVDTRGNLGQPIGTGRMISRSGHFRIAAKSAHRIKNAPNHRWRRCTRSMPRCPHDALVNVLNHGFAEKIGEGLAGKACGGVTGRE